MQVISQQENSLEDFVNVTLMKIVLLPACAKIFFFYFYSTVCLKRKKSLSFSFSPFSIYSHQLLRNQGIIFFLFSCFLCYPHLSLIFLQGRRQRVCNESFPNGTKKNMTITRYNKISSLANHVSDTPTQNGSFKSTASTSGLLVSNQILPLTDMGLILKPLVVHGWGWIMLATRVFFSHVPQTAFVSRSFCGSNWDQLRVNKKTRL